MESQKIINPKERKKKKKRGTKNRCNKQKTNNKRPDLNPTMLIITINVSDLNNLIKRQKNVKVD